MAGPIRAASRLVAALQPRQREAIALTLDGLSNEEIARRMGCSTPTVRAHHLAEGFVRLGLTLDTVGCPRTAAAIAYWLATEGGGA